MTRTCRMGMALLWSVVVGASAPYAEAAWLQLGDSQVQDGVVYLPIIFDPGPDTVASLQFDVPYEDRRFVFLHAEPGPAAITAGKDVLPGVRNGKVTVVIAGLNQSAIGAGVLAALYFELIPEGKGDSRIALENHVLSDPRGNAVALRRPRDESPSRSDRPVNAPEAPNTTERGSTMPDNEQDGATSEDSTAGVPQADGGPFPSDALGRFGPQALHDNGQPAETSTQEEASAPGHSPANTERGLANTRTAEASGPLVRSMPEHMPVTPSRPAASPEPGSPKRPGQNASPLGDGDARGAQNATANQAPPLGQAHAGDGAMPLSREQLAAIQAARVRGASADAMVLDSDTSGGFASRPLPVGAMVFTALAAFALLAFTLRQIGIRGVGRRSIKA